MPPPRRGSWRRVLAARAYAASLIAETDEHFLAARRATHRAGASYRRMAAELKDAGQPLYHTRLWRMLHEPTRETTERDVACHEGDDADAAASQRLTAHGRGDVRVRPAPEADPTVEGGE